MCIRDSTYVILINGSPGILCSVSSINWGRAFRYWIISSTWICRILYFLEITDRTNVGHRFTKAVYFSWILIMSHENAHNFFTDEKTQLLSISEISWEPPNWKKIIWRKLIYFLTLKYFSRDQKTFENWKKICQFFRI